ncbi:hypothetical protein [Cerasicoccus arenae]|uniref:DUF4032 domain-containing protein n=1 Tax=Cerasicoccus arenae TaxID=424488 RepID=A0A8J3DDK9_9BACT|nr:hypothetical protein [Cerasicoccus arenae]MBK1858772.1 hypothetical protein [Cerasicoccus arenae]GHC07376.1 hypothetical protein GCM10007047_25660 [Cerasicoccus arenae]
MKAPERKSPPNGEDLMQRSSLYQEFLAEREEILRHKWIESEKRGYDIGFERALLDWIRNHRDKWRSERRDSPDEPIEFPATKRARKRTNTRPPAIRRKK